MKRKLNPGTFQDLWDLYSTVTDVGDRVSQSVIFQAWRNIWSKVMPFRDTGQGKRCSCCAQLDAERDLATDLAGKREVAMKKHAHINHIKAVRQVNVRSNTQSEHDAAQPSRDGWQKLLKISIDGMDQSKFRCPRNLALQVLNCLFVLSR